MAIARWARHAIMGAESIEDCFAREGLPFNGKSIEAWGDRLSQPVPGALAVREGTRYLVIGSSDDSSQVDMLRITPDGLETEVFTTPSAFTYYWPKEIDLPTSYQPLMKSNVIRGASLALMSSLAVFSGSVTEILTAIDQVKLQMSDGSVYSLVASGVIIVGLLIVLGSRVRGKISDAKLEKGA